MRPEQIAAVMTFEIFHRYFVSEVTNGVMAEMASDAACGDGYVICAALASLRSGDAAEIEYAF